eukprot:CAMPEP_0203715636 /NCGR_PEP_ID=MMETSP0092-20131115/410_1 /ASSEMBLY_ACC=CAM_ASM_001090 /TAXON_ID=426623 /ORGANISM="Chaetoceros affinis, Strain CCMP159" /LENGTH=39 /DNA_ID= /DNA_START= /DNA_END= /DNA_ORIENTATION=
MVNGGRPAWHLMLNKNALFDDSKRCPSLLNDLSEYAPNM